MAKANQGTMHADDLVPEPQPEAAPVEQETAPTSYGGGKYNNLDDFEKGYGELDSKIGEMGNEVGSLRSENAALNAEVQALRTAQATQQAPAKAEPATDYQQTIADVAKAYDAGDMTFDEALLKTSQATAQQATLKAEKEIQRVQDELTGTFQSELQTRDNQVIIDKFHAENPDFAEVQASGALEAIKGQNPMHDDFSAFWALKAAQAKRDVVAQETKMKAGSEDAGKVLAESGQEMQAPKRKPRTEAEVKASMLTAFTDD